MWLERISGGSVDLIELQDAKSYLRILSDDMDAEVQRAIASATAYLDVDEDGFGGLGFPLVQQVWGVKAASFCADVLRLPFGRVTAINEIRFTAPDHTANLVPVSDYQLTRRGRASFVTLLPNRFWPQLADLPDAVDVRFTAGYLDVATVPEDIKAAARLLVGHFFENRLAVVTTGVPQELKIGVDNLTSRYRHFAA